MNIGLLRSVCVVSLILDHGVAAYTAVPRWGQATAIINDALFIYGGMTDQFNSYSYTSAPSNNDLLFLSLSVAFDPSSPPWQLVSSSTNSSTSQGPALAWHTLSAFNTSGILLFGGQAGPNSPTVVQNNPDSAALLDVYNRLSPTWTLETPSWAGEPIRRMRHSTATTPEGLVYIIGGEEADGSENGFSDHYIFNPNGPSFTQLPPNGPPDIYGHTSIILANGHLLIFGGYCQSQATLLPFTTIWAIDTTQSNLSWTTLSVSNSTVPSSRRAFAAVLVDGSKILIHGGSDADFLTTFNDGWILDTSQSPLVWTPVDALSQLGPRRDHFAVAAGSEVIFGFGYGSNGPAPAGLQIYDIASGMFIPTYSPPPPSATITQTLPGPSQTSNPNSPSNAGSSGYQGTGTNSGVHPTATVGPGDGPNGGGEGDEDSSRSSKATAIAVGTVFGILGLVAVGVGATYYYRRRQREKDADGRFSALGNDGDDGESSPHLPGGIPTAGSFGEKGGSGRGNDGTGVWTGMGILNSLGLAAVVGGVGAGLGMSVRNTRERRDMLADEDTRDFGPGMGGWYAGRRDGSGGSSWSLKSILGGGATGRPRRGVWSREPSTVSTLAGLGLAPSESSTPWRERTDPFSDGAALMTDEETGYVGATARLVGARRHPSYASTKSGTSYIDPFADPIQEEAREPHEHEENDLDNAGRDKEQDDSTQHHTYLGPPPPPVLRTLLPLSLGIHTLSPLSEQTSLGTLTFSDPNSSVSSHDHPPPSPFDSSSHVTSHTSLDPSRSPLTTSIIDANPPPAQSIRRSDSWWTRFSRTSFLDRRASDASRRSAGGMFDIRDPNPPPRLIPIEESTHSVSPDHERDSPRSRHSNSLGSLDGRLSKKGSRVYGGGHGKSMSSLQTARTADSEAIERMAGTMDVVQRVRTGRGSMASTSTTISIEPDLNLEQGEGDADAALTTLASPDAMTHDEAAALGRSSQLPASSPQALSPTHAPFSHTPSTELSFTPLGGPNRPGPTRGLSGGAVAARIQAYERQMSQDREVPSPTNTKYREEKIRKKEHGVSINYGLVPRPSLYVANPDHRITSSGDS